MSDRAFGRDGEQKHFPQRRKVDKAQRRQSVYSLRSLCLSVLA